MAMTEELRRWRADRREELIARRLAASPEERHAWSERITRQLLDAFPMLQRCVVGFCWPYRGEFDPRFAVRRLREGGARAALPRVVARGSPLQFQAWWPGAPLRRGVLGIPVPDGTEPLQPQALLVPPVGIDARGYRLGYGAGYFDRTLASPPKLLVAIGVGYELARMETIRPQRWDVPMDWVVTERGVYRRDPDGLVFLGEPAPGEPGALASPVCYADEIDPRRFDDPGHPER